MTKQWRLALPKLELRHGWLVLLAFLTQLVVMYVDFGDAGLLRRLLYPASYVLLLTFVILNRRRVGFLVIGSGMFLNFLAIVSNGGLMPISPSSMEEAGLAAKLGDLEPGDAVPGTINVLLEEEETNLGWLTDRLTWDSPAPISAFSIGDVLIGAGLIVTLVAFLLPVVQRVSPDRPSLT